VLRRGKLIGRGDRLHVGHVVGAGHALALLGRRLEAYDQ
jgi:hypothetical protein